MCFDTCDQPLAGPRITPPRHRAVCLFALKNTDTGVTCVPAWAPALASAAAQAVVAWSLQRAPAATLGGRLSMVAEEDSVSLKCVG